MKSAKNLLKFIRGTLAFGLMCKRSEIFYLIRLSASNYVGDCGDRKST